MTAAYYSHLIGPMSKKVDRPVKATLPPSEIKNKKEQPTQPLILYISGSS